MPVSKRIHSIKVADVMTVSLMLNSRITKVKHSFHSSDTIVSFK